MDKVILEPLKLLVIGKTGVGKSAFCNFFFGEDIFESNIGEAVTKNINSHKFIPPQKSRQFKKNLIPFKIHNLMLRFQLNFYNYHC